jgi:hypothetical protein
LFLESCSELKDEKVGDKNNGKVENVFPELIKIAQRVFRVYFFDSSVSFN